MDWYYMREEERIGPLSELEFQSLVDARTITSDSLVRHEGMTKWQRYEDVRAQSAEGVSAAKKQVATGGTHACAECGNVFPADEMVQYGDSWVCAACKPVFFQRLKEGAPLRGIMTYGGFWIRFAAKFIDWLILGIVNAAIQFGLGMAGATMQPSPDSPGQPIVFFVSFVLMWFAQLAVALSYTTWFLGRFAATPGKMACGLKVVTSDGGRVTYLRAFARYFAELLSGITLFIGYIMAAFDDQRRTLHDRICDTRVIRK